MEKKWRQKGTTGLFLCLMVTGLSGCANRPLLSDDQPPLGLMGAKGSYIQINATGDTQCYTRVIEGLARDQICQKGDFVRYSDTPDPKEVYHPIPDYVLALFDAMSDPVVSSSLSSSVTSHTGQDD